MILHTHGVHHVQPCSSATIALDGMSGSSASASIEEFIEVRERGDGLRILCADLCFLECPRRFSMLSSECSKMRGCKAMSLNLACWSLPPDLLTYKSCETMPDMACSRP